LALLGFGIQARRLGLRLEEIKGANMVPLIDPVRHTSTVAEIQNTIRRPYPVVLADIEAKEVV